MKASKALQGVAALELTKGVIVLFLAAAMFLLARLESGGIPDALPGTATLNPTAWTTQILNELSSAPTAERLGLFAGIAVVYSLMRFIEAYGLYWNYLWARWFGFISAGIYVPYEVYQLTLEATWITGTVLALNLVVLVILGQSLWQKEVRASLL